MPGLRETLEAATPDDNYAGYGEIMEALERERDEWRALALDMGEGIREIRRKVVLGMPGGEAVRVIDKCDALLARLSRLGAGPDGGGAK